MDTRSALIALLLSISSPISSISASEEALALRRIADFWEEGEYSYAKNQMEQFLAHYPESSYGEVLCTALGDLHLREKNYKEALDYYTRVKEVNKVFLNRMQCLYHLQWHATLSEQCEEYLAREVQPHHLQATYYLAIALYEQALSAPSEMATELAGRAKPHFETLAQSPLSDEVAGAFAHLRCILNDFEGAAQIYLRLGSEEYLFQAALLQAKFDKKLAVETFSQVKGTLEKEAAYNQIVLLFDLGCYNEIIASKLQVPLEKEPYVHLFVGQSYLALGQYAEAAKELSALVHLEMAQPALIEAAYRSGNLALLEQAIQTPSALFYSAMLHEQKLQKLVDLVVEHQEFPERPQAYLEIAKLETAEKSRDYSLAFLKEYPDHELASFAWRMAAQSYLALSQLSELEELLKMRSEESEWAFLLAKAYYEQGSLEKSKEILKALLFTSNKANAELLYALCEQGNPDHYCSWAEAALAHEATLLSNEQQHIALFNAYIARAQLEPAAQHLYSAFQANAEISMSNLQWLADFAFDKGEDEMALKVMEKVESTEELTLKLAKLHRRLGNVEQAIALFETIAQNRESKLNLAELLNVEQLFDEVAGSAVLRDRLAASAALQSARLKLERLEVEKAVVMFKDLSLQKNLENEPIHLEAALDYVALSKEKLSALMKMKAMFESQEDLLSKDYHAAREKLPKQNLCYLNYMQYIDAEILLSQAEMGEEQEKELRTKAKELLLQIASEDNSPLRFRVERRLEGL